MLDWLCRIFLHPAPAIKFSTEEMQAYEQLALNVTEDGLIEYDLPYAKFRYLTYVSLKDFMYFTGQITPAYVSLNRENRLYITANGPRLFLLLPIHTGRCSMLFSTAAD